MNEKSDNSGSNGHGGVIGVIVVIALIWFVSRLLPKKEVWIANYERATDNRIYSSQEFSSADACAAWIYQERKREAMRPTGRYNFECGLNCKPSPSGLINYCEKTFDN